MQLESHFLTTRVRSGSQPRSRGQLTECSLVVIGFISHLQVVITNNYYTIADLHNLQSFHIILRLFSLVLTIRFLATDLQNRNYKSLTKLHTSNSTA
jgi:hypothetical protein